MNWKIRISILCLGLGVTLGSTIRGPLPAQERLPAAAATQPSDTSAARAQELDAEPPQATLDAPAIPPPLKVYKGRVIAQTMHYRGAEWLTRDSREQEERCSLMLANLGLRRGMTVCDMGCGNGFYTVQIAKIIGPSGKVIGVDIQPQMLKLLNQRAAAQRVKNVVATQGTLVDPRLPRGEIDLILCVDVYHEFSHPEQMLAAMRQALAPGGLVALVEFRAEDPKVPIRPEHKMTKAQILKEWLPNGFKLVREFDGLPWQHMMFFAADEAAVPNAAEESAPPRGGNENGDTP